MIFSLVPFTKNSDACPSVSYSAIELGNPVLPTGVTFNPTTLEFEINSSDDNNAGTFTIEITGLYLMGSLSNSDDFDKATLKITMLPCRITAVQ